MANVESLSEFVARLAREGRLREREYNCYSLYVLAGNTIREVAAHEGISAPAALKHLRRAQATLVLYTADEHLLREARTILRLVRNEQSHGHGRHARRDLPDALPEWVTLRQAALLCRVDSGKVRAWVADGRVRQQPRAEHGRHATYVATADLPLPRPTPRSPLMARIITEDDLVEWRPEGGIALGERAISIGA